MEALRDEMAKPYFAGLQEFVAGERRRHEVYPPEPDTYAALRLTPLDRCRVVILAPSPLVPCASLRMTLSADLTLQHFDIPRSDLLERLHPVSQSLRRAT